MYVFCCGDSAVYIHSTRYAEVQGPSTGESVQQYIHRPLFYRFYDSTGSILVLGLSVHLASVRRRRRKDFYYLMLLH